MKRGIINKAAKITGYSYNTVNRYSKLPIEKAPNKALWVEIHATINVIEQMCDYTVDGNINRTINIENI